MSFSLFSTLITIGASSAYSYLGRPQTPFSPVVQECLFAVHQFAELRPIGLSDGGSPGDRGGPAGAVVHALPRMVHDDSKGAGLGAGSQGPGRIPDRQQAGGYAALGRSLYP